MAWTAKPSATQRIERRSEPYLTDALKQKWSQEILPKYATKHGALMPILHEVQHAHRGGPIPKTPDEIEAMAARRVAANRGQAAE